MITLIEMITLIVIPTENNNILYSLVAFDYDKINLTILNPELITDKKDQKL